MDVHESVKWYVEDVMCNFAKGHIQPVEIDAPRQLLCKLVRLMVGQPVDGREGGWWVDGGACSFCGCERTDSRFHVLNNCVALEEARIPLQEIRLRGGVPPFFAVDEILQFCSDASI